MPYGLSKLHTPPGRSPFFVLVSRGQRLKPESIRIRPEQTLTNGGGRGVDIKELVFSTSPEAPDNVYMLVIQGIGDVDQEFKQKTNEALQALLGTPDLHCEQDAEVIAKRLEKVSAFRM